MCLPTSRRKSITPIGSVQSRLSTRRAWNGPGLEVEEGRELLLDGGGVAAERLAVEQVALLAAPARVADHARRAAGERDREVAGELEAPQQQQRHEVPDVQAVGGRVEADVERHRPALEPLAQRVEVGVVLHEPAREQVVDDGGAAHARECCKPAAQATSRAPSSASRVHFWSRPPP